jgi:hypothetical protein
MKSTLFLFVALSLAGVRAAPVPRTQLQGPTQNVCDDNLAIRDCALVRRGDQGEGSNQRPSKAPRRLTEDQKERQKQYHQSWFAGLPRERRDEINAKAREKRKKETTVETALRTTKQRDYSSKKKAAESLPTHPVGSSTPHVTPPPGQRTLTIQSSMQQGNGLVLPHQVPDHANRPPMHPLQVTADNVKVLPHRVMDDRIPQSAAQSTAQRHQVVHPHVAPGDWRHVTQSTAGVLVPDANRARPSEPDLTLRLGQPL